MSGGYQEITSQEIGVVARSKKETCDILTTQGLYYFPPIESTRASFVADVITGSKKVSHRCLHFYRCFIEVMWMWESYHKLMDCEQKTLSNLLKPSSRLKSILLKVKVDTSFPRSFIWNLGKKWKMKSSIVNSIAPK